MLAATFLIEYIGPTANNGYAQLGRTFGTSARNFWSTSAMNWHVSRIRWPATQMRTASLHNVSCWKNRYFRATGGLHPCDNSPTAA